MHLGVGGFFRSHQAAYLNDLLTSDFEDAKVRRCRWAVSNPALKTPMVSALQLTYDCNDEPHSSFAFSFI